jgi:RND family efflux transporter MFP subunit
MQFFITLIRSVIALSLAGFTGNVLAQGGPPPATVRLGEIVELDMARTITTPASVSSRNDAQIAAEATGRVTFIAEPGDMIDEGGVIARLDDREAQIRLDEARARLARANANATYQESEVERMERLTSNGTVAATRLREIVLARDLATQDQREARSAVARAQLELDRTQIRAPFNGRVAERLIQVGERSAPGRDIARLVDIDNKEAIAQAPVAIAPYLTIGQMVTLSTNDGEDLRAPIRAIIPIGDAVSRTFEVRIDLEGSDWIVGSAVRAAFPAETPRTQLAAPYDAVILRSSGASVFIVGEDSIAQQVSVTTGVREDGYIAISGDLEPGQPVVVSGAEVLSDGRPVQEIEEEEA